MDDRYDLTDVEFEIIQGLLPRANRPGGRWNDHRATINGIFWYLRTGRPWRSLPGRYGNPHSVSRSFSRWRKDGTLRRILTRLVYGEDVAEEGDVSPGETVERRSRPPPSRGG